VFALDMAADAALEITAQREYALERASEAASEITAHLEIASEIRAGSKLKLRSAI
jgi:hypothetical protein